MRSTTKTSEQQTVDVSVLLSVYDGDLPEHVDTAIESIFRQTYAPSELIIVKDGLLGTDLTATIEKWARKHPNVVTTVGLDENQGLGRALQIGLEHCSHELVARMDADDISVPDRLEKQLAFMRENPEIDVLGGYVAEFSENPDEIDGVRQVPTDPDEVTELAPYRCPLNHPTVMYRKSAILAVGGYSDRRSMQDYELWMRLLDHGCTLTNLPEVLVKARAGTDLYDRRGGFDYAITEYKLQRQFLQHDFIRFPVFLLNLASRIPIRLAPKRVRKFVYSKLLRSAEVPRESASSDEKARTPVGPQ